MTKLLLGHGAATDFQFAWEQANGKISLCAGSLKGDIDLFSAALRNSCHRIFDDDGALHRIVRLIKMEVVYILSLVVLVDYSPLYRK